MPPLPPLHATTTITTTTKNKETGVANIPFHVDIPPQFLLSLSPSSPFFPFTLSSFSPLPPSPLLLTLHTTFSVMVPGGHKTTQVGRYTSDCSLSPEEAGVWGCSLFGHLSVPAAPLRSQLCFFSSLLPYFPIRFSRFMKLYSSFSGVSWGVAPLPFLKNLVDLDGS